MIPISASIVTFCLSVLKIGEIASSIPHKVAMIKKYSNRCENTKLEVLKWKAYFLLHT